MTPDLCLVSVRTPNLEPRSHLGPGSGPLLRRPNPRYLVSTPRRRELMAVCRALTQRSAFGYWLSIAMTATPIATTVTIAPTGPP